MTQPKRIKLTDLLPDRANANAGTERGAYMVDTSIAQFGAGRSILLDKDNEVIAGNKTLQALVDAGYDEILVIETDGKQAVAVKRTDLDLDDPQSGARGLAYADNRASDVGLAWDAEQLLADVNSGIDLGEWFHEDELAALLEGLIEEEPTPDPGPQIDRAAELNEVWQVERGQIWEVPSLSVAGKAHRVMCGDSTSEDDVQALLGGQKADLFLTDPPYGVSYADKNIFLNMIAFANRIEKPIENDHLSLEDVQTLWLRVCELALKYTSQKASYYWFACQGGDQMMMMMMIGKAGWKVRHELIWVKNNHVLGRTDYNYKHEPILYGWKKDGTHEFFGGFQTSVLEFPKPQKSDLHPTTKPLELIALLITNSTKSRGYVLDLFLGSGTTLVACEQLGRVGYGMEISENYVAVTLQRLADMGLTPRLLSKSEQV